MTRAAQIATLPDGRLHLHNGPIDLIVSADGPGYGPKLQPLERSQQVTYLLGRVGEESAVAGSDSVPCETIAQLQEFL